MAKALAGLGTDDLIPLVNPQAELEGLSAEEYFVLTRIDGRTSLHEVILICGLGEARALATLQKLRAAGAIFFKGETPTKPVKSILTPAVARPGTGRLPTDPLKPETKGDAKPEPKPETKRETKPEKKIDDASLAEDNDLTAEQRRAILVKHAQLNEGTLFDLLEVPRDVDRRGLRAAYFKLSKVFHPDVYYGKRLGTYQRRLADIFEMVSKAFNQLEDDGRREEYLLSLEEDKGAGSLTPDDTTRVRRPRKN
ncbi:MAG TPA: J domain-containing protein [Haliangiales bacterium]|nr:J domain-containing protein [Haliangiales bacterium]